MQYVSIDVETTGLEPADCQVLEFAAVIADTTMAPDVNVMELPWFQTYVTHTTYYGEAYGLSMHPHIFRCIAKKDPGFQYTPIDDLGDRFRDWLKDYGIVKVTAAGKNFGAFDLQFLQYHNGFNGLFKHRFLDPAMLFFDPLLDDETPSLALCLERAGFSAVVSHVAVDDARDVIRCLQVGFARRL